MRWTALKSVEAPVLEQDSKKEVTVVARNREPKPRMVPLFSLRSILFLAIGVVLGTGAGMGYWAVSPSLTASLSGLAGGVVSRVDSAGVPGGTGEPQAGPHEAKVQIDIVNPGSSYVTLKSLQQKGEYYAAKAVSFPFLKFLSEELDRQAPQYSHAVDELQQIMKIRYDWKDKIPPAVEVKMLGTSDQEASFLAGFVPKAFLKYLGVEESEMRRQAQEDAMIQIASLKGDIYEAQKELTSLELRAAADDINGNPTYLALSATVEALKVQLDRYATELAILIAQGNTEQKYTEITAAVQRTSKALAKAKSDIAILKAQARAEHLAEDMEYLTAKGRVENLTKRLANLTESLNTALSKNDDEWPEVNYLAVGQPSIPVPVAPERIRARNALMLGAIIGVGAAWVLLNLKWISRGMPSSPATTPEEDEENEA